MKRWQADPIGYRIDTYTQRNNILRNMGFSNYAAYLKSPLWDGIRASVLARNPCCFVCEQPASQVHHTCYRRSDLTGKDMRRLVSLCAGCHHEIEFRNKDHEKLNVKQATVKMRQLRKLLEEHDAARP